PFVALQFPQLLLAKRPLSVRIPCLPISGRMPVRPLPVLPATGLGRSSARREIPGTVRGAIFDRQAHAPSLRAVSEASESVRYVYETSFLHLTRLPDHTRYSTFAGRIRTHETFGPRYVIARIREN